MSDRDAGAAGPGGPRRPADRDGGAPVDILIRGAHVYDGTGAPSFIADVAVRGDRIARITPASAGAPPTTDRAAGRVIDATGLALAPGFIDVHSHDDFAVLLTPAMDFKLMQGVTSEVVGNCGLGPAPYASAARFTRAFHPHGELPHWDGHAGYFAALDRDPPSLNVGVLAGHGTLRHAAMRSEARPPSERELVIMRESLAEGLAAGVLGLSTGLIYDPGRHARSEEIVALARELAGTGALYASHMRDEGDRLLDAIRETLEVGAAAGVPVQVSHHKAMGRANWGKVRESLALLDEARAGGVDVAADQYPYTAASTVLSAVVESGMLALGRPEDFRLVTAPGHPAWEGKTLPALAGELGLAPEDAARRIVAEEGTAALVVCEIMDETDVQTVLRHPTTMIGSDGIPSSDGKPHPRLYGTFARVLGRYARDLGILTLAEAVHRMTGLPATRFGLAGRGAIRTGAFADLVVFDPATIADTGTYDDPRRHPAGIRDVFVNGVAVVRDGRHTGARPGRALRRTDTADQRS